MNQQQFDALKLENQICFPLYACAKEVVRQYRPYLDKLDLTYTQYITMMVLWQEKEINVKSLGEKLYLDSGTLTPVLKSLEGKGYVCRIRSKTDERVVLASITQKGEELQKKAISVPEQIAACVKLDAQEAAELYRILYKVLSGMKEN